MCVIDFDIMKDIYIYGWRWRWWWVLQEWIVSLLLLFKLNTLGTYF